MNRYNLKFKNEPNERGFWNTSIYADSDEEAKKLFEEYYKDCLDVRILDISEVERKD